MAFVDRSHTSNQPVSLNTAESANREIQNIDSVVDEHLNSGASTSLAMVVGRSRALDCEFTPSGVRGKLHLWSKNEKQLYKKNKKNAKGHRDTLASLRVAMRASMNGILDQERNTILHSLTKATTKQQLNNRRDPIKSKTKSNVVANCWNSKQVGLVLLQVHRMYFTT